MLLYPTTGFDPLPDIAIPLWDLAADFGYTFLIVTTVYYSNATRKPPLAWCWRLHGAGLLGMLLQMQPFDRNFGWWCNPGFACHFPWSS